MSYFNPSKARIPKITVLPDPSSAAPLSNRRLYLGIAGGVLVALMAGGGFKLWQHRQLNQSAQTSAHGETLAASGAADSLSSSTDFTTPFLPASSSLTLAEPSLLQSTASEVRIPAIVAGRPDPFAPLVVPAAVPDRPTPDLLAPPPPPPPASSSRDPMPGAAASARPRPAAPAPAQGLPALPPLPTVTIASLPAPPIPVGVPTPAGVEGAAALAVESEVEQVTISGVVQIGQQVHVIITEPSNPSGRRVSQGDTLAGGQVRIKAIDLSGVDPTVVLTYNGRDYFRTVSGTGS